MKLGKLTKEIPGLRTAGDPGVEIESIVCDSRKVTPGSLFVALKGERRDGADYLLEATRRGAAAVMLSEDGLSGREKPSSGNSVSLITSREIRKDMALIACRLYGSPTERLKLMGVTGTNGKTTTTYLAESMLKAAGKNTGVIGTISYRKAGSEMSAVQTTPDAIDLQRMFKEMADAGVEFCVLEVSSHALELHRVYGSRFETCVFTNLSQDHLDFHGDMESYFNAKRRLFLEYPVGTAIINADDPWGRRLLVESTGKKLSYGIGQEADIIARELRVSMEGVSFTLLSPHGSFPMESPLAGEHNVSNILAASAIALAAGIGISHIQEGAASLRGVPGRFQRVHEGQDFDVIVDYAHTEDALRRLLTAARKMCAGRLIIVFGCGGDRDKGKRPLMGRAAAELGDLAVITSDNPRTEDPMSIIEQIEEGLSGVGKSGVSYMVVPDRRDAIRRAVAAARPGDMVVIAGKGHEKYQIVGDRGYPFDDVEEVRAAIAATLSNPAISGIDDAHS